MLLLFGTEPQAFKTQMVVQELLRLEMMERIFMSLAVIMIILQLIQQVQDAYFQAIQKIFRIQHHGLSVQHKQFQQAFQIMHMVS